MQFQGQLHDKYNNHISIQSSLTKDIFRQVVQYLLYITHT